MVWQSSSISIALFFFRIHCSAFITLKLKKTSGKIELKTSVLACQCWTRLDFFYDERINSYAIWITLVNDPSITNKFDRQKYAAYVLQLKVNLIDLQLNVKDEHMWTDEHEWIKSEDNVTTENND